MIVHIGVDVSHGLIRHLAPLICAAELFHVFGFKNSRPLGHGFVGRADGRRFGFHLSTLKTGVVDFAVGVFALAFVAFSRARLRPTLLNTKTNAVNTNRIFLIIIPPY